MTGGSTRRIALSYLQELSGEQGPSEKRFITTNPPISIVHTLRSSLQDTNGMPDNPYFTHIVVHTFKTKTCY